MAVRHSAREEMTGGRPLVAADVLGLFAAQALLATCIAAVALVLPVSTAALAIAGLVAAAAAVTALAGKQRKAHR